MYAFFFCLFVCFNWPKWVLLFLQCDEVLLCTERWTGDFFLIYIYIYIYSGVGGRICNTLQCSCEAVHPEMGLGCKATVLPTVTNFNFHRFPPSLTPCLGCKLNSFLVLHNNIVRTSKHHKFSWRQTWLITNCLTWFYWGWSLLSKASDPQWRVSWSPIWLWLVVELSTEWLLPTSGASHKSITFSPYRHQLTGMLPFLPTPHLSPTLFISWMREPIIYPDSLLHMDGSLLGFPKDPEDWTEGCYYEMYLDVD